MKRLYSAVWCCLALALSGCIEQSPLPQAPQFEHTYGDAANEVAGSAYPLFGGGHLLVGGSQDPDHHDYDLYIVKVDAAGNQVFARRFGERDRDEVGWKVTRISTGEYAVLGTSRKTDGGTSLIQISLLDPNLDLRWQTSSATNVPNSGLSLRNANFYELPDGHFIAGFGTVYNPVVMRFDSRGAKIDETVLTDYSSNDFRHCFARDARGRFAMCALSQDYLTAGAYFDILHYDSLGNYTQTQRVNWGAIQYGQILGVTGLRRGGYALTIQDGGQGQYDLALVDENTVTLDVVEGIAAWGYTDLLELPSGDLLLHGADQSQAYFAGTTNMEMQLLDSSFAVLRSASYGGQGVEHLRAAAPSPTGALLLGETDSYGAGGTDLYVVFLND